MIVRLNNIKEILNSDLSVCQRGLLITILLLKDSKPEYTLAKLKSEIKLKEYYQELIALQDKGYIEWTGYASAKDALKNKENSPSVVEVIEFMNELYGRKFNANSDYATKGLKERLKDYSVEQIKLVVANRWEEWKDDAVMSKHLNPTTIFRPSKFEKYIEEAERTNKGQSLLEVKKVGLEHNQEFTFEMIDSILDKDVYTIKTYDVDGTGNRITSGMKSNVYGSDLKKLLKSQQQRVERGGVKEQIYIYQG